MVDSEKITMIRALTGSDDEEAVLVAFLAVARDKILNRLYPYHDDKTDLPEKYQMLQCEIAAYLLNKRGAEGQTAHSENGISRSYGSADVPAELMNRVTPYIGVM